eukprot:53825-Prymnesium_polylepis.1
MKSKGELLALMDSMCSNTEQSATASVDADHARIGQQSLFDNAPDIDDRLAPQPKDGETFWVMNLYKQCMGILKTVADLDDAAVAALRTALEQYVPAPEGLAECQRKLSERIWEAVPTIRRNTSPVSRPRSSSTLHLNPAPLPPPHPMRGTPLSTLLHTSGLWEPQALGFFSSAQAKATRHFDLSHSVERCDYFLSHMWSDEGMPKVEMLGFLLLHAKLATSIAALGILISISLTTLGFGLRAVFGIHELALVVVVAIGVVMGLSWVGLSAAGYLPNSCTPAAFSKTTIWL